MTICAYTAVCEEDACWVHQYLDEAERLSMPFCVHLDRCSIHTRRLLTLHPLCRGETYGDGKEFRETDKQGVFDLAVKSGVDWVMAWDVDETWEPRFADKVKRLDLAVDYVDCPWLNLWEDAGTVRIDGPFSEGHRVKFYNTASTERWKFKSAVVNGPSGPPSLRLGTASVVCIHHGLMTHELRVQHKARWDRIYSAAVGSNPYGIWNYSLAYGEYPPVTCSLEERLGRYS